MVFIHNLVRARVEQELEVSLVTNRELSLGTRARLGRET
jgi:hypothetical protein